jgi:hypothetical protein
MPDPSAYSPSFQVDTDTVGAALEASIAAIDTGGPKGGPTITITTTAAHHFGVGWEVTIQGLTGDYEVINGVYSIIEIPSATTFRFSLTTNLAPRNVVEGKALSPSPSYIRYIPHDTLISSVTNHTTLYVEPWDYNTIRVTWGTDVTLNDRAVRDINNGHTPLVVITRSGFGYPSTPIDGVQVLAGHYHDYIVDDAHPRPVEYVETMPVNTQNDWTRQVPPVQGLYDRNLPQGHWFYYTVFFYLGSYDDLTQDFLGQVWVKSASMDAVTPVNHHHAERLYDLVPEYYQFKDSEFLAGTGRRGVVERFLQVIGFDLDYTLTLADGIEHVYDVDTTHDDLLHSLGVFNFGVPVEDGLGDIRYRSLLATVSRLYEERGSAAGLQQMTNAATKYRCKVLEGPNMMNLADDAEFASGTGSWGNPVNAYADEIHAMDWLGRTISSFNAVSMESVPLLTTPEGGQGSLVVRRNAMEVGVKTLPAGFDERLTHFDAASPFDGVAPTSVSGEDIGFDADLPFDYIVDFDGAGSISDAVLLTCGLGEGITQGRRHEEMLVNFYPRLHGIRCMPEKTYTFSGYSVLSTTPPLVGNAAVGIMWFNEDEDGIFTFNQDFISKDESVRGLEATSADDNVPGPFRRFSIDSIAPLALRGENYVFAVPYWVFTDSQARYISACMFHPQVNTSQTFALPTVQYLRLGMPRETLDSGFVLGSP